MKQTTPRPPTARKKLPDWLLFFGKFLRHGRAIASFVPSSVYLSRAILKSIDFARARVVVELGAGTGPITAELLRAAPGTCRCVIVERDPDFCARLRERFPQAEVVQGDACDIEQILAGRGITGVDHYLCGLPLPSFPADSRDKVLGAVKKTMTPDGTFRQLTHMPWVYQRLYKKFFAAVKFHLVFRNLPPAGFYVCQADAV